MLHIKKTQDGCHIFAITEDDDAFISALIAAYEVFKKTYYYPNYVRVTPEDINNDVDQVIAYYTEYSIYELSRSQFRDDAFLPQQAEYIYGYIHSSRHSFLYYAF